ncbi:hypothetical protein [Actinomadura fibrosa]|uniref:Arsenate reductase n=1 Tax=Actinomadura fibrosa TaxID=111802 RepID=A0ABW2XQK2_9ACTN|nr:hypothetical protein [Actinomadura fibrosa]
MGEASGTGASAVGAAAPVACTLPPDGMADRLAEMEALFARGLTALEREPLQLRLTFTAAEEAGARDLFAREQECCAFLTFTYIPVDSGVTVAVTAPPDAAPTLDGLEALANAGLRTR